MEKVVLTPNKFIFLSEQDFFTCELSIEEIMEIHGDENQNIEDVVDRFEFLENEVRYVLNGGGVCANNYQYSGIDLEALKQLTELDNAVKKGDIVVDPSGNHFLIHEESAFYVGQDTNYEKDWLKDGEPIEPTIFIGTAFVPSENGGWTEKEGCVWQKNTLVNSPTLLSDFEFNGSNWAVKNPF